MLNNGLIRIILTNREIPHRGLRFFIHYLTRFSLPFSCSASIVANFGYGVASLFFRRLPLTFSHVELILILRKRRIFFTSGIIGELFS
jgi:hypothetical protein